jgi:hypothetical protein
VSYKTHVSDGQDWRTEFALPAPSIASLRNEVVTVDLEIATSGAEQMLEHVNCLIKRWANGRQNVHQCLDAARAMRPDLKVS